MRPSCTNTAPSAMTSRAGFIVSTVPEWIRSLGLSAKNILLHALISGVLDRLPVRKPLRDQLRAFPIVASVQDAAVLWSGAQVDTGRARVHFRVRIRTSRPVPGRALGRLQPDLSRPVQLRCVRIQRPFSLPIVKES